MMKRDECLKALKRHVTDEIVVATYSSACDWYSINPRALNYFSFGAMGLASSHGLGFALGFPNKRVLVLDGDGSLLMNLSTLVTIAAAAPKNLTHFVAYNGSYEANGRMALPKDTDFVGLARAAGYAHAVRISTLADFEAQIADLIKRPGPVFVMLDVEQGVPAPLNFEQQYSPESRAAFKVAVNA